MTSKLNLLLIIVTVSISSRTKAENNKWKSEDVTKLFKLMMNHGNAELKKKNEEQGTVINQYLVAVVLSEDELKDSKNWNALPETITHNNNRIKIIFNDKYYQNFPYKTKKPLHGEVLMLMDRNDLPVMINKLRDQKKSQVYPYVVLYSHYIPCAEVKGVEYHCSEELAKNAIDNRGKYTMLVGFKEIFKGTSRDKSVEFMNMGGIQQFELKNGIFEPLPYDFIAAQPVEQVRFFQYLFYACLNLSPVSESCCTVDSNTAGGRANKEKILARYVNTVTYTCTSTAPTNFRGKLTDLSRWSLSECVRKYAESHTGDDCPNCPVQATIYTIKVCGLFASAFGTEVGRPENPNDPNTPRWIGDLGAWNTLYNNYNVDALQNRPAMFCLKKTNDLDSLCTKLNVNDDINKKVQNRAQTFLNEYKQRVKSKKKNVRNRE